VNDPDWNKLESCMETRMEKGLEAVSHPSNSAKAEALGRNGWRRQDSAGTAMETNTET
jgi:hypothetical protein